jgi:hypothetical protein
MRTAIPALTRLSGQLKGRAHLWSQALSAIDSSQRFVALITGKNLKPPRIADSPSLAIYTPFFGAWFFRDFFGFGICDTNLPKNGQ